MYHLSKNLLQVLDQFQRDSYDNCSNDKDIVSCEWMKEIFVNNSDPALIKKVKGKYGKLYRIEQGGVTYLNISLYEMFNMSDVVITLLQELFENFARDGVAKYPNINVALLVHHINAVAECLAELPLFPRDMPLLVLTGFTKSSVPEFVGPFELIINTERVI